MTKAEKLSAVGAVTKKMNIEADDLLIQPLGIKTGRRMPCIPVNLPTFDEGVLSCGGLPRGRILEVYGPESAGKTTFCLHAIGQAQQAGLVAAFVDATHALDVNYAKKLGVNMDELILSQPNFGEQAIEVVINLVESRGVDIVVIDDVTSLIPKAELEGEMTDASMGAQARLMSKAMRKLVGVTSKTGTVVIFINQVREKIGVMFGCFHYNSRVVLGDGKTEKIGKIVNQRLPVTVRSFDPRTGRVQNRQVIGWFNNGHSEEFLQFEVEKVSGNGISKFGVTPNHLISTPLGEQQAHTLASGDLVLAQAPFLFSKSEREFAIGSILGDGGLRKVGVHTISLRHGHGKKQDAYCRWKQDFFNTKVSYSGRNSKGGWSFDLKPSTDLLEVFNSCYVQGKKKIASEQLVKEMTERSVAIWYADDGTFSGCFKKWGKGKSSICAKGMTKKSLQILAQRLVVLGFPKPFVSLKFGRLDWSGKKSYAFQKRIAPYIHPSMGYKLHPSLRGQFQGWEPCDIPPFYRMIPVKIIKVYKKPLTRSNNRFDLEVEGNHRYLIDGVGVHNSPEVTTGGRALKFFASVRLEVRRLSKSDGGDVIDPETKLHTGHRMRLKNVKNKVGPPFRETVVDLDYATGIDKKADMIQYAVNLGVIEDARGWFIYKGERYRKSQLTGAETYDRIVLDVKAKAKADAQN